MAAILSRPQWVKPSLAQIVTCRLFGTKPLSEPMMGYCYLNQWWVIVTWTNDGLLLPEPMMGYCYLNQWWVVVTWTNDGLLLPEPMMGYCYLNQWWVIVTWTNGGLLLLEPFRKHFDETVFKILSYKILSRAVACDYAQSNILSKMAAPRGQASGLRRYQ